MLYITGIQSVRILKRLHRRFVRFVTPAVELAGIVYAKTIGKQLNRLKKEIHIFQDNFRKDGEHLKELSKDLTLQGAIGRLQHAGLHFVIRKKFVMSVLNIAAPIVLFFCCLLPLTIITNKIMVWCSATKANKLQPLRTSLFSKKQRKW